MTNKKDNVVNMTETTKTEAPKDERDLVMYITRNGSRGITTWEVGAKAETIQGQVAQKVLDVATFEEAMTKGVELMEFVKSVKYNG
jgi:hypothetical protein